MKHFRFVLAGFLCFLVFQVVPGSSSAVSAEDPAMTSFDREVFITLINRVRQKESYCNYDLMPAVEPVVWCDTLAWAALKHCKDMYYNDFYCHTGSDGSNSGQRVLEQGYRWRTCAENLYKGSTNESKVFYRWFGSAGHCKNMMHGRLRRMGVARYGEYWAMVLTN
jgi:uncharacterized protein YkwD